MPIAEMIPSSPDQGSACVGKRCVLHTCLQGHVWSLQPLRPAPQLPAEGPWGLPQPALSKTSCTLQSPALALVPVQSCHALQLLCDMLLLQGF